MANASTSSAATPRQKKASGIQRVFADVKEFVRITNVQGGLIPQSTVATILGVSRQRVHQLVSEGTLSHWTFYGMKWLSQNEIAAFVKLSRPSGENQHQPSAKEMWKASRETGDEFIKSRRKSGH